MLSIKTCLTMKNSGLSFGWVNVDTVQKIMEQSTQWVVSIPNTFPMIKHLKSRNNRILSKVQKSFWSCTHVNSCQKYTLYINLHILLNILSKATSNIQESRKFIKRLKRKQKLMKKRQNPLCLVIT